MPLTKLLNPKSYINKISHLLNKLNAYLKNKHLALTDKRNRIGFSGWFLDDINWKKNFIFNKFIPNFENWTIINYKPHLEYFSVFGKRNDIKKSKASIKIFWTGEDVENNFPDFKDNCVTDADLSLGFTPENKVKAENYIRYPLWLLYYFGHLKTKEELSEAINKFNSIRYPKHEFCSLVASHDSNGIRTKLIECLNPIATIKSAGKFCHNDDSLVKDFGNSKENYLQQFIFNICPENISVEGYTTEKIFQSFSSGCIPIYYGSNGTPEPAVVNPESFISFTGNNQDEVFHKVKTLWESEKAYNDFISKPRLLPTTIDYIFDLNHKVKERIIELVNQNDCL